MYRCIWACIGAVCNTCTDSNASFDSDVPKCAEISYRRKVLPDVANNKLHKRLEQKDLHKKSLTKKKFVEGEWVGRKHLPTSSFNLRPCWPPASRCDCTHLQRAPRQATSLQASQQTCHFDDDLIGLGFRVPELQAEWHWNPRTGDLSYPAEEENSKVRFWLRVHKRFFWFSIWSLQKAPGIAQLVFFVFSSVSDFVLVSFVSVIVDFNCICCSVARAVLNISSERLDGQIQVVSTESSAFRELNGSKSPPEAILITGCFWASVQVSPMNSYS